MALAAKDIPKENVFAIGRGIMNGAPFFHVARPRLPFVFSRAEALNLIGYIVAHEQLKPGDVDEAAAAYGHDPFRVSSDGARFMITGPQSPLFLITRAEALSLMGHLIRKGNLLPEEIDAAMVAIGEQAQGQSIQDVTKLIV